MKQILFGVLLLDSLLKEFEAAEKHGMGEEKKREKKNFIEFLVLITIWGKIEPKIKPWRKFSKNKLYK